MNDFISKFKELPKEKRALILSEIEKNGRQYNIFPLSTEQSQMWVLYQLDKESPYYSVPMYLEATKQLKTDLISKTINKICSANTVLKSVILCVDGQAYVYINKDSYPTVREVRLESKKDVLNHMEQEYKKPFNLEEEIPIRVIYYEIADGTSFVFFNVHHMFVDAYSGNIIFDTFINEYSKLAKGIDEKMKISKYQYSDFSVEQKSWNYEKESKFWQEYLKNASFFTNLPHSYPSSVLNDKYGNTISVSVAKEKLVETCIKLKVSCYAYLLAVYYILLSKVCGQDNITIGTPTFNRNTKTEKMIGYFSNTIPLNARIDKKCSFSDFVQHINSTNIDCIDNAKLPFSKIVELNSAHRDDMENPIFQTLFTYHGKSINFQQEYDENEINFTMKDINERMELQFDLLCTAVEENEKITCNFTYRNARFSNELMNNFVDMFLHIFNETILSSQILIGSISGEWKFRESLSDFEDLCGDIVNQNEVITGADICFFNNCFVIFYSGTQEVSRQYFLNIISKNYTNDVILFRTDNVYNGIVKAKINDSGFADSLLKAINCREQLSSRNAIIESSVSIVTDENDALSVNINCFEGTEYSYYKDIFGNDVNIKVSEAVRCEKYEPANTIEQDMIEIWKKVLNKDNISVTDSFFALGGTSLKCIKLADEINTFFNCDFNIATLFKYSNIRDLSRYLSEALGINAACLVSLDVDNVEEI